MSTPKSESDPVECSRVLKLCQQHVPKINAERFQDVTAEKAIEWIADKVGIKGTKKKAQPACIALTKPTRAFESNLGQCDAR